MQDRLEEVLAPLKTQERNRLHKLAITPLIERLRSVRLKRTRMQRKASRVTASLNGATSAERTCALVELRALYKSALVEGWEQDDALGDIEVSVILVICSNRLS